MEIGDGEWSDQVLRDKESGVRSMCCWYSDGQLSWACRRFKRSMRIIFRLTKSIARCSRYEGCRHGGDYQQIQFPYPGIKQYQGFWVSHRSADN